MRNRIALGLFFFALTGPLSAQWTNTAEPTLATRAGIGGAVHASSRLRLTETTPGSLVSGPFHLTFGNTTAQYWGIRLDGSFNLHLDRQSSSGWKEGVLFDRDGDVGIGLPDNSISVTSRLYVAKDANAGTVVTVSNPNVGASAYSSLSFEDATGLKAEITSTSTGSADPNSLRLWNYRTNGTLTMATANLERMRIFPDGNVAIGLASNQGRLFVYGSADAGRAIYAHQASTVETSLEQWDYGLMVEAFEDVNLDMTNAGGITGAFISGWSRGPGTVTHATGGRFVTGNYWDKPGTVLNAIGVQIHVEQGIGSVTNGYGVKIENTEATNDWGVYQEDPSDENYFAGSVAIGLPSPAEHADKKLYVKGNARFDGEVTGTKIRAHYQDVAEWVPSDEDLAPGVVVVLDKRTGNTVRASMSSYDTAVAGVVSADPGVILGEESPSSEQVATTGRVRVRVDASKGAIAIGDLLVTSDVAGTAMKSMPIEVGGFSIHRPGTIIGKALEPLESGTGEILVPLSLQ